MRRYGHLTARQLNDQLTEHGTPWAQVTHQRFTGAHADTLIPRPLLKAYYEGQMRGH